jgi:RHS repeat-associated protein
MSSSIRAITVLFALSASLAMPLVHAVGRTEGRFSVSPTGSGNYTIPISVPPGPRGVQPNLALVYDSRTGNGVMGPGWSLSGLGEISRCNKTYAQDGAPAGVTLATSDGYCLDGRRLRRTGGVDGYAGSTYQTELADFSQATAYGAAGNGPSYFIVQRKDGLKYEYGNTTTSKILGNGGTAIRWLLNRVSDRAGNSYVVLYGNGTYYSSAVGVPARIDYAPSSAGGTTYTSSIVLTYASRPVAQATVGYVNGTPVKNNNLLTNIQVNQYPQKSRSYRLTYEAGQATTRARLAQVQECAYFNDCLPATSITYQDGQAGVANPNAAVATAVASASTVDMNGDGRDDLIYATTATGGYLWYVRFADASGGLGTAISTGLITSTAQSPSSGYIGSSNGVLFDDFRVEGRISMLAAQSGGWVEVRWNGSAFVSTPVGLTNEIIVASADVDGDGRPDLVSAISSGSYANRTIYTRLNTSAGGAFSFAASTTLAYTVTEGCVGITVAGNNGFRNSSVRHQDYDGNGRADVMMTCFFAAGNPNAFTVRTSRQILLSQGATFALGIRSAHNYDARAFQWVPLNWNDDACTDFYYSGADNSTTPVNPLNISGCGVASAQNLAVNFPSVVYAAGLDWDSDGRTDLLIGSAANPPQLFRSQGESVAAPVTTGIVVTNDTLGIVLDQNGDGLDDLMNLAGTAPNATVTAGLHNGTGTWPDLATNFTDGYGVSAAPTYISIARSNYTKGSGASYPEQDIQPAMYVVSQVAASDGNAGTYQQTFSYTGARQNTQGRGFYGFEQLQSVDSRNGTIRRTHYLNGQNAQSGFPLAGMVDQDELLQGNGTIISRTTATHLYATLDGTANYQRYFPHVSTSTARQYEVGGAKNGQLITTTATNYTFDNYGNATNVATTISDNDSGSPYAGQQWTSTVARTITADTGINWCLGVPTQVSTTNTAPGASAVVRTVNFTPDYPNCRVSQQIVEPNSGTYAVTQGFHFDPFGNVDSVSVTGAGMATRTTTIDWGTTGRFPVTITNPLSQATTRAYDYDLGVQTSETDPNGLTVSWGYDDFGRKTSESRPDGTSTTWTYANCSVAGCVNGNNRMTVTQTVRNAGSSVRTDQVTYLDQFDRPLVAIERQLSGAYSRVETRYDSLGRVSQQSAPCNASSCAEYWATNQYDILNRMTQQQRPISAVMSTLQTTSYQYLGRTTVVIDPQGKSRTTVTTVAGTLGRSQDHNGYYQNFSYDGFGSLLGITDSVANALFSATYDYGVEAFQRTAVDMDLGARSYTYNALGELTVGGDAKGQSFLMTYDALSRPRTRTEAEGTTTWTWGGNAASHNIGRLESVCLSPQTICSPVYAENYSYDALGRLSSRQIVSDATYTYDYAYDSVTGALQRVTYPTSTSSYRLALNYVYQNGVLEQLKDANGSTVFWRANATNARGQVTQETLGNGVVTQRALDAVTGRLSSVQSGIGSGAGLQNESYLFDQMGNLTQRQNNNLGLTENFYYDDVYRLEYSTLGGVPNLTLAYDAMGNITSRSDVASGASWTYHASKKHAVTQAGNSSYTYSYDANGNAITRNGYAVNWSSYNYPIAINGPGKTLSFAYDPNRQRYRQNYVNGSTTETTMYIGGLLEKVTVGTVVDWRHYIRIGSQTIAVMSRQSSGANTTRYMLEDHQSSVAKITDSSGATYVNESFSAFGARRDPATWSGPCPCPDLAKIAAVSRHGYTGHEAIGGMSMGLNHMNGRVQDAITGRFLSADPYVSEPGNTQNYNRYSYVHNNPLSYIDPSGFDVVCYGGVVACDGQLEEVITTARRVPVFGLPLIPIVVAPAGGVTVTFPVGGTVDEPVTEVTTTARRVGGENQGIYTCKALARVQLQIEAGGGRRSESPYSLATLDKQVGSLSAFTTAVAASTQGNEFLARTSDWRDASPLSNRVLPTGAATMGSVPKVLGTTGLLVNGAQIFEGFGTSTEQGVYASADAAISLLVGRAGVPGVGAAFLYSLSGGTEAAVERNRLLGLAEQYEALSMLCYFVGQ